MHVSQWLRAVVAPSNGNCNGLSSYCQLLSILGQAGLSSHVQPHWWEGCGSSSWRAQLVCHSSWVISSCDFTPPPPQKRHGNEGGVCHREPLAVNLSHGWDSWELWVSQLWKTQFYIKTIRAGVIQNTGTTSLCSLKDKWAEWNKVMQRALRGVTVLRRWDKGQPPDFLPGYPHVEYSVSSRYLGITFKETQIPSQTWVPFLSFDLAHPMHMQNPTPSALISWHLTGHFPATATACPGSKGRWNQESPQPPPQNCLDVKPARQGRHPLTQSTHLHFVMSYSPLREQLGLPSCKGISVEL